MLPFSVFHLLKQRFAIRYILVAQERPAFGQAFPDVSTVLRIFDVCLEFLRDLRLLKFADKIRVNKFQNSRGMRSRPRKMQYLLTDRFLGPYFLVTS